MIRSAKGVALAWFFLFASVPFAGAIIYLLIGERRVSPWWSRLIENLQSDYKRFVMLLSREVLGIETGQILFIIGVVVILNVFKLVPLTILRGLALVPYAIGGVGAFWTIERVA